MSNAHHATQAHAPVLHTDTHNRHPHVRDEARRLVDGRGEFERRRATTRPHWRGEPVVGCSVVLDAREHEQFVVERLDQLAGLEWRAQVAGMPELHEVERLDVERIKVGKDTYPCRLSFRERGRRWDAEQRWRQTPGPRRAGRAALS